MSFYEIVLWKILDRYKRKEKILWEEQEHELEYDTIESQIQWERTMNITYIYKSFRINDGSHTIHHFLIPKIDYELWDGKKQEDGTPLLDATTGALYFFLGESQLNKYHKFHLFIKEQIAIGRLQDINDQQERWIRQYLWQRYYHFGGYYIEILCDKEKRYGIK